jgi:hypothetical protein
VQQAATAADHQHSSSTSSKRWEAEVDGDATDIPGEMRC